jgi:hypothetical protein
MSLNPSSKGIGGTEETGATGSLGFPPDTKPAAPFSADASLFPAETPPLDCNSFMGSIS